MVPLGKKNIIECYEFFFLGGGGGGELPPLDKTLMVVSKPNHICGATILYNTYKSREEFAAWSVLKAGHEDILNIPAMFDMGEIADDVCYQQEIEERKSDSY